MVHQGIAPISIASMITHHFEEHEPGITIAELSDRLTNVAWPHFKSWLRQRRQVLSGTSSTFTALRFGRESWQHFPELASVYKAAMVKALMYWTASFLTEFMQPTEMSRLRAYAAYALARFQFLQDTNGPWLDDERANEMYEKGREFLVFYQALGKMARAHRPGRKLFKIVPKFHCLLHACFYIKLTKRNPRYEHLYMEEDFMKHIALICGKCHPATMDTVALLRYRSLMELC